jgi:hypothetical protein
MAVRRFLPPWSVEDKALAAFWSFLPNGLKIVAREGLAVRIIVAACAFALMLTAAARSETDVLLRAVGFALTGSDDAEPKVIGDRANCIFAIKNKLYRLNNVHVDRVTVQAWENKLGDRWITVKLHGDDVVFEETTEPLKDDGTPAMSELVRQLRVSDPDALKPHHNTYKETELRLTTTEQERVKRAWQYIYSHGCTGKQSPF